MLGINRKKQIAKIKKTSESDIEFISRVLVLLLSSNDFTNEQLVKLIDKDKDLAEIFSKGEFNFDLQGLGEISVKELQEELKIKKPEWIKELKTNPEDIVLPIIKTRKELAERLREVVDAVNGKEFPTSIKIDGVVYVEGEVDVKKPKWWKPFNPDSILDPIKDLIEKVSKRTFTIKEERPLKVVVSDLRGKALTGTVLSGGGAGLSNAESTALQSVATASKQDQIITAINGISGVSSYYYVQKEEGATYTYYGFANTSGWQIKRKTISTGVWEVASGSGDYATAWADRANKTYGYA